MGYIDRERETYMKLERMGKRESCKKREGEERPSDDNFVKEFRQFSYLLSSNKCAKSHETSVIYKIHENNVINIKIEEKYINKC